MATERRLSVHTITAYRRDLRALQDWCKRNDISQWDALDHQHVRRFAAQSHARGLQGRSIQRRLAALRTFFGFLLREGQGGVRLRHLLLGLVDLRSLRGDLRDEIVDIRLRLVALRDIVAVVQPDQFGAGFDRLVVGDWHVDNGGGNLRALWFDQPYMLERFLKQHDLSAEVVVLSGAVEIAPRLGRADAVCDLVSTGSTLQANHLREVLTVLESHAVLIRTPLPLAPAKDEWAERLLMRIDGVQQVKESKYIMLHAPRSALPEIRRLLPGSESPTIIPLEGFPDRVAVHAVCRENVFWETLESLKKAGASAMLVLPVEKMLV